jgi:hypothetical protein
MTTLIMPPLPNFVTARFFLETNTQRFESPITKTVQRVLLGGSRWNATYTLPAMKTDLGSKWQAFFLQCAGSVNAFAGFDPDNRTPRGPAGGTPLVAGGSQTGNTLAIDGCTSNALFLKAGDYFSVNGELKMQTVDTNADGSGNVTLTFMPALRSSPADNTPIITDRPSCTMVLSDDMQAAFDRNHLGIFQPKTFTAIEVFS